MRTIHILGILVLLALAVPAAPAHAGGVVTVCDEAHLRAALAGGGTVTFSCSGTIILSAEIVIAADTTIDGSGQEVTISGNDAVGVFHVIPLATLNLNRLTVANGWADDGGGVYNAGTLAVNHCVFTGNRAHGLDTGSGGPIFNAGSLTMSDSILTDNHASGAFEGNGGAIANAGTLIVRHSTFTGNSAQDFGGAIHGSNFAIDGGAFVGNSAIFGGAISGSGLVENCAFTGNSGSEGGAINGGGRLTVNNSTFASNNSDLGGGIDYFGGTYYDVLTVRDSTFSGNTSTGEGGGVFIAGTATVAGSTFNSNSAVVGGGISSHGSGGVTVSNSTFVDNSASFGGGIYGGYGTLTLSNSTLSGNSAGDGGGIYGSSGTVTLKNTIVAHSPAGGNCSGAIADGGGNVSYPDASCPGVNSDPQLGPLQDNGGPTWTMALGEGSTALDAGIDLTCVTAPVNGRDQRGMVRPEGPHCDSGAVEQAQEPVVTLVEVCDEAHLRAALAGGGTVTFACSGVITLADEIALAANVTIDGSGQDVTISGNHAVRVFRVDPGWTLTLRDLAIADGAAALGGAIYVDTGAVTVSHSQFSGHSGGAIVNDGGTLTVSHSQFSGHSGGAIVNDDGTLTVSQSTFSANDGRSISNNGSEARLTVRDSLFSGNNGGGIYNGGSGYGGTATVTNSTFVGNTTVGPGGAIHNDWASFLTVTDSTFSGNRAAHDGGSIFSYGSATVGNCTFSGNSAGYGGGIYTLDSSLAVIDSVFNGNTAQYGGAISGLSSGTTVRNCTFIGNHAGSGGGIEVSSGLTVSNSTFVGNSAADSGGAIAGNQGPIAVSDSTFSGNSALSGGGIYAVELSTVRNSTFYGNSADYGGGIYTSGWASYAIEVSNSTFSDNSAVHDGGGIYHRDGVVEVTNSSLADNQAASGGGIYSHPDGTVMLKNTIVANNPSAENCAGTIIDGGGNLSFPDATCPGINAAPLLGLLQDNGGPTWTMALGPGSAAIDAADDDICAAPPVNNLDQRGVTRPQGAHCDIGAVEQIQEPTAVSLSMLSAESVPGTIPPVIVFGLLLAVLAGIGAYRRARPMGCG